MASSSSSIARSHPRGLKLFLDLDGVLADFDEAVMRLLGRHPDELPPGLMWSTVRKAPNFFGTLRMMADAKELWAFAAPYQPTILTGKPMG